MGICRLKVLSHEEALWKIFYENLVVLGPCAFFAWAGLEAWRGHDAHLNLNLTWNIALSLITLMTCLTYAILRLYLVIEVFALIPYMKTDVYKMAQYAICWPHRY